MEMCNTPTLGPTGVGETRHLGVALLFTANSQAGAVASQKGIFRPPTFLNALSAQEPMKFVLTGSWLVEAYCGPNDALVFFLFFFPRCLDFGSDETPSVSCC
jgi:hypothetical protein